MQRYVARSAENVINAGVHFCDSEWRSAISQRHQNAASPTQIHVRGKAYEPVERKINIAVAVKSTRASAIKPRRGTRILAAFIGWKPMPRSTSAAQIARIRWKNGSQRNLQRKRPAVGVMQSASTTNSNMSSHFIRLTSSRPRHTSPATRAAGATRPQANSASVCGTLREEKSVQF